MEDASTGAMCSCCGAFNRGPRTEVTFSVALLIPTSRQSTALCLGWPRSVGIAAAVTRPLGDTWHLVASWAGHRDLPLVLGVAQTAGPCLIRCQRCLSLGLSLLSRAPRANIPGIFVMFGSIQHPSEQKKKSNKRKSGSSTAPFSVLLHLSFLIPALNNTLYGEA